MLEAKNKYESNLHRRFIVRVLAPPFLALFLLGSVALWQLGNILHKQAITDLKRSATTTAATLEREFSLRETVLKQTGTELFIIKNQYNETRKKLDYNRDTCRAFVQLRKTFNGAPDGVCEPFQSSFAVTGASLASLESEYVRLGEKIVNDQNQRVNERLSAFKQLFPETLALVVINDAKQPVSSAVSGVFKGPTQTFQPDAVAALSGPVRGKLASAEGFELAIFAFPIQGGSVLAAYDLQNEHFVRQVWVSAPVDRTRSLTVLLDSSGNPAYPSIKDASRFQESVSSLRQKSFVNIKLDKVEHTVVGAQAGSSEWLAAVASPTAAVLAPLRDAQLAGVIFIGIFMVGFLWVGTFFIQRTLRNIVTLVSGAIVFGAGKLDYRIALDHADGEFVRLADTMNAMAERIAAAERSIDEKNKEFISVATHELRTPLTAIIGNLTLFQDLPRKNLDSKAQHTIDQVYYSTVRLRDLVNDMLNVARLESGGSMSALAVVPIKPVVADIISNLSIVANIAQVKLFYEETDASDVMADDQRLRIVINNLLSNAIKYNRPQGYVRVSHTLKADQLVTMVEDNGLGIPDGQKARMFEKFYRVQHDDRRTVTGTGLGMYITKQYVEQMGGRIWFESSHGTGTKFYFSLPLAKQKFQAKIKKLIKRKLNPGQKTPVRSERHRQKPIDNKP